MSVDVAVTLRLAVLLLVHKCVSTLREARR